MDVFEVQDFLEQKGLSEFNFNIVLDQMRNPYFVNVLKRGAITYQQPIIQAQPIIQP